MSAFHVEDYKFSATGITVLGRQPDIVEDMSAFTGAMKKLIFLTDSIHHPIIIVFTLKRIYNVTETYI